MPRHHRVNMRRLRLIIFIPLFLLVAAISIFVGFIGFGGFEFTASALDIQSSASAEIVLLLMRCALVPFQLFFIMLLFIAAFSIHRKRDSLAQWLLRGPIIQKWVLRPSELVTERALHTSIEQPLDQVVGRTTAVQVTGSAISFTAYAIAVVLSLGQFLSIASLGLLVTVITGGLSWGARTMIGDLLGGMSNIAEDNFNVGDHISTFYANETIEGVVESVTVRVVHLRADTGELFVIPHGELRILHNFSRGAFGGTYVEIHVASQDLDRTVELLGAHAPSAETALPALVEPWQIISRKGDVGQSTSISLFCKAVPGMEHNLQLETMMYVADLLSAESIQLSSVGGSG